MTGLVSGLINATALNRLCSRHIVQPAVTNVGAAVLIRTILFVLSENNKNPFRQVLPLKSDGRARLSQLADSLQTDDQFA